LEVLLCRGHPEYKLHKCRGRPVTIKNQRKKRREIGGVRERSCITREQIWKSLGRGDLQGDPGGTPSKTPKKKKKKKKKKQKKRAYKSRDGLPKGVQGLKRKGGAKVEMSRQTASRE